MKVNYTDVKYTMLYNRFEWILMSNITFSHTYDVKIMNMLSSQSLVRSRTFLCYNKILFDRNKMDSLSLDCSSVLNIWDFYSILGLKKMIQNLSLSNSPWEMQ